MLGLKRQIRVNRWWGSRGAGCGVLEWFEHLFNYRILNILFDSHLLGICKAGNLADETICDVQREFGLGVGVWSFHGVGCVLSDYFGLVDTWTMGWGVCVACRRCWPTDFGLLGGLRPTVVMGLVGWKKCH